VRAKPSLGCAEVNSAVDLVYWEFGEEGLRAWKTAFLAFPATYRNSVQLLPGIFSTAYLIFAIYFLVRFVRLQERNLYLVLQTIELDVPVVVALNMVDALAENGQVVDVDALSDALGVPVVPVVARRGEGIDALVAAVDRSLAAPESARPGWRWQPAGADLEADIAAVAAKIPYSWHGGSGPRRRALALWALLSLAQAHTLENIPDADIQAARRRQNDGAPRSRCQDIERHRRPRVEGQFVDGQP